MGSIALGFSIGLDRIIGWVGWRGVWCAVVGPCWSSIIGAIFLKVGVGAC